MITFRLIGKALDKRRKARRQMPHIDSVETQLSIAVHTTQITEQYPFTKIKSQAE